MPPSAYTTPATGYYSNIMAELGSNKPGNQILGNLASQTLPTLAAARLQAGEITQQLTLVRKQESLSNAYTQAMAHFTLQQLGIRGQQIGLQQQTNTAEQQLAQLQNQLEQQQYGITIQKFGTERKAATLAHQNALLQFHGREAASGTQGGTGARLQAQTIATQYKMQLAGITRAQQMATLGQKSTLASQQFTAGQLQRASQNLSLLAQANGLSEQQVQTRLNYALQQNQLSAARTTTQLLGQLGQVWQGEEASAAQAASLGAYAGMNVVAPPPSSYNPQVTASHSANRPSPSPSRNSPSNQRREATEEAHGRIR